jgi:hypothetical protein
VELVPAKSRPASKPSARASKSRRGLSTPVKVIGLAFLGGCCLAVGYALFQTPFGDRLLGRQNNTFAAAAVENPADLANSAEVRKKTTTRSPVAVPTAPAELPPLKPAEPPPLPTPADNPKPMAVAFEQHIRPIFVAKCLACHGSDPAKIKGGLDMRTVAGILKGGKGGPAVVPGSLEDSPIWTTVANGKMPPPSSKLKLSEAEKAILQNWILGGAKDSLTAQAKP